MAGDWIKMRADLLDDPTVDRLAEILEIDTLTAVGALFCFWAWADKYSVDGHVDGATSRLVDKVSHKIGFCAALVTVGWLVITPGGIDIPRFDRHNGQTAKERSLKNQRQARWREGKSVDEKPSTQPSTREEKRREESSSLRSEEDAGKPAPRKRREDTILKTYLETCKASGLKPIPSGHPIRDYCADAHITDEMLQLAWIVFKDRFTTGKDKAKRQKDWPAHFANSVRGRWANLWHTTEKGETCWTSAGLQERTVAENRMKPHQGDSA